MQSIVAKLLQGDDLSFSESQQLFNEMLSGDMDLITVSAILVALKMKGEAPSEVSALVKTMRNVAYKFEAPEGIFADCCGTGGDGLNTFNVSTASAFVAAECGLPIIKHGNRSASSRSGSADIIEAIGIDLKSSAVKSRQCLDTHQYCFLFAPEYHPLMAHVVPVRKQLATSTIFNLAGPLANPAAPPVQLLGVCREELCLPMAEALVQLDCKRALVVYGSGLDEVALHGKTTAVLVDDGKLQQLTLTPESAGLTAQPIEAIQLSDEDQPVDVFNQVIQGKGSAAMTDMVALNAGTLLWLAGCEETVKTATTRAKQALLDGAVSDRMSAIQGFYND